MAISALRSNGVARRGDLVSIPGPGAGLSRGGAAESWLAMREHIIQQGGPAIAARGPISAFRDLAGQQRMRNEWCARGQCEKAAVPGTSNHGWGTAVDVATPAMEQWILRVGPRFGWSHAEGARVKESWHFTYVGGFKPKPDPLRFLTAVERDLVQKLEFHRAGVKRETKAGKAELARKHAHWVGHYDRMIRARMKKLRELAKAPNGGGWAKAERGKRYQILKKFAPPKPK